MSRRKGRERQQDDTAAASSQPLSFHAIGEAREAARELHEAAKDARLARTELDNAEQRLRAALAAEFDQIARPVIAARLDAIARETAELVPVARDRIRAEFAEMLMDEGSHALATFARKAVAAAQRRERQAMEFRDVGSVKMGTGTPEAAMRAIRESHPGSSLHVTPFPPGTPDEFAVAFVGRMSDWLEVMRVPPAPADVNGA